MFRKNRAHLQFSVETEKLGELNGLITTAVWKDLSEKANTGAYDNSPQSFITYILEKTLLKNLDKTLLETLSDDDLDICKNNFFKNSKKYLLGRQKALGHNTDRTKDTISFKEFLILIKDIKKANEKETRELFKCISSKQTLSIADQLNDLTSSISSENKDPELNDTPSTPLEPIPPLKKVEEALKTLTKLLKSSGVDADQRYKEGRAWNWIFFGVSIIALVASAIVGGFQISQANNSSKETEHILSSQQVLISKQNELLSKISENQEATNRKISSVMSNSSEETHHLFSSQQALISKQNELLSKILESQETTNNQIRLVLSERNSHENNEGLNTLKSIESLLIKNNFLLTQTTKDIKTN